MTNRRIFTIAISLGAFLTAASMVANAYDGLTADFEICTKGDAGTQAPAMILACSRLIDNAKAENETVGMFYAIRASVNDNKARNCRDARKATSLIKDPALRGSLQELVKTNC
jgi:hypothetical protein